MSGSVRGLRSDTAVTAATRGSRKQAAPETVISIDGGIGRTTIGPAAQAGARLFVVGSEIFDRDDYAIAMAELDALAAG